MRATCLLVAFATVAYCSSGVCHAQEAKAKKAAKKSNRGNVDLDPVGKPDSSLTKMPSRFTVWYDERDKHWAIRTTSQKGATFTGAIRATNGNVRNVLNVGLKEKKQVDQWHLNAEMTELTFSFRTGAKADGLNFRAFGENVELTFDLKIDGKEMPRRVIVGKSGGRPGALPLKFPGNPVKKGS